MNSARVIDVLEIVQIDHEHRAVIATAGARGQSLAQPVLQQLPVGQARQLIEERQVADALLEGRAFGEVQDERERQRSVGELNSPDRCEQRELTPVLAQPHGLVGRWGVLPGAPQLDDPLHLRAAAGCDALQQRCPPHLLHARVPEQLQVAGIHIHRDPVAAEADGHRRLLDQRAQTHFALAQLRLGELALRDITGGVEKYRDAVQAHRHGTDLDFEYRAVAPAVPGLEDRPPDVAEHFRDLCRQLLRCEQRVPLRHIHADHLRARVTEHLAE
jgi:hypothetical protein